MKSSKANLWRRKSKFDWEPKTKFEDGIIKTIDWYIKRQEYL